MVVTARVQVAQEHSGGLRPMDPTRDLKAVADLIAEAFADEMDERGRAALRELRWMARLSPLMLWWSQTDPSFQDSFNGFVWEVPSEKGTGQRLVGNVSLNRAPGGQRRYIICNVVVQDLYRGKGIARRLMQAAMAEARDQGAGGVVLQVYEANTRALQLYIHLGFEEVAGEVDLRLDAVQPVRVLDAPDYRFRRWQPRDGKVVYKLVHLVTPPVQQWLRPLKAEDYRPGWWLRAARWLGDQLASRHEYRLSVFRRDRLIGLMTVSATFKQGEHHLVMLVHPDHRGQVERALVSRALHMLGAMPPRPVVATVDKGHTAALEALHNHCFEDQRTLLTLRKDFL
jgi:ribosomal protein S18 acetylase RimI-like enzyme